MGFSIYSNIFPDFCPFFHCAFKHGKRPSLRAPWVPSMFLALGKCCKSCKSCAPRESSSGLLVDLFCKPNVTEGFSIKPRLKRSLKQSQRIERQSQGLLLFREDTDSRKLPETEQALYPTPDSLPWKVDKSNKDKTNYRDNNSGQEKSRDYGGWEGRRAC